MLALYGVAAFALICDQLSKWGATHFLRIGESMPVLAGVFHLSLVQNTGIAFGLFQEHPDFWIVIITASLLCLVWGARLVSNRSCSCRWAYGLILGGAAGNWIDRIRVQHVIDFLDFRIWPVFNLADASITLGVFSLIWLSVTPRRRP